jgi:hypothetical protein
MTALRRGDIPADECVFEYDADEVNIYYGDDKYDFFILRKDKHNNTIEVKTSGFTKMYITPRGSGTVELGADKI